MIIITFCGHAQFSKSAEYERIVLDYLTETAKDQPIDFYLGGYGEFDSFAYDCAKTYQKTHPHTSLYLITPYMTATYQKNHLTYQKDRYDGIIYPELENKPQRLAISYRNKWMVEQASYIIAYVDHAWGGAYSTYQYAKRKGKTILNLGKLP